MYHPRLIENSHPTRLPRVPTTSTLKYCTEYGHGSTVEICVDMHKVTTERSVSVGRSPLLLHASNKSPSGSGQRGIFRCGRRSPPLLSRCFSFSVRSSTLQNGFKSVARFPVHIPHCSAISTPQQDEHDLMSPRTTIAGYVCEVPSLLKSL